jgi:rod shape determining protein RodA
MTRKINTWANLDWLSVFIFFFLILTGWISVYSAVYDEAHQSIFDTSQRYGKQLIWIITAVFIAAAVMMTDTKLFLFFSYFFYGLTILMLIGILFFGVEINGQKAWFQFGGLQIQPSEFAKMATALALAQYISSTKLKMHDPLNLLRIGTIIFLPVMLIMLQPDPGSAIVFFAFILVLYREGLTGYVLSISILFIILSVLALLMGEVEMLGLLLVLAFIVYLIIDRNIKLTLRAGLLFLASGSLVMGIFFVFTSGKELVFQLITASVVSCIILISLSLIYRKNNAAVLLGLLLSAIVYTYSVDYMFENVLLPHQKSRINIVLGFDDDPMGQSYNINQSKIAIGSGGLTGKGFLQGTQTKFNFVPEQSTDFIFCTIGEEWGFAGSFALLAILTLFLLRLVFLAERQRSSFSRIYGYCIITVFFTHIVINIGMTIGVVPVIGIPLPFISYGGSSLWAFTLMLFTFLRLDAGRMEFLK